MVTRDVKFEKNLLRRLILLTLIQAFYSISNSTLKSVAVGFEFRTANKRTLERNWVKKRPLVLDMVIRFAPCAQKHGKTKVADMAK